MSIVTSLWSYALSIFKEKRPPKEGSLRQRGLIQLLPILMVWSLAPVRLLFSWSIRTIALLVLRMADQVGVCGLATKRAIIKCSCVMVFVIISVTTNSPCFASEWRIGFHMITEAAVRAALLARVDLQPTYSGTVFLTDEPLMGGLVGLYLKGDGCLQQVCDFYLYSIRTTRPSVHLRAGDKIMGRALYLNNEVFAELSLETDCGVRRILLSEDGSVERVSGDPPDYTRRPLSEDICQGR